jgi:hypothetical protein
MKLLIQMYSAKRLVWKLGSPHIVDVIEKKSKDGTARLVDGLIATITKNSGKCPQLGGMVGYLVECRAPQLLAKGGTFKQRVLNRSSETVGDVTDVTLGEVELKHHSYQELPNLEALLRLSSDGDGMLHDMCGVFPALDAMRFPNTAYQFTHKVHHPVHLETIVRLNTHLRGRKNGALEICFAVPHAVFGLWKREQSYTTHTVTVELRRHDNEVEWRGRFQSGVLLDPAVTEGKYPHVSVALRDRNVEVTIAGQTVTIPKSRLISPKSKDSVNVAVAGSSTPMTLVYTCQTNDIPFVLLSPEVQQLLDGVTQKVICLPDVNKDVTGASESARILTGADTPAQLVSLLSRKARDRTTRTIGGTTRSMVTVARVRSFGHPPAVAASMVLRVVGMVRRFF